MSPLSEVSVARCHDAVTIERFLREDYFDYPVCLFSPGLIRAAAKWLAASDDAYFMVGESSGQPAGFVFAHLLGFQLWRVFAREHPRLLPHMFWVLIRLRWFRRWSYPHARFRYARPQEAPDKMAALGLPSTETPFQMSEPDSKTAYIDLLLVSREFRGNNLGVLMLQGLVRELCLRGVSGAEAHIDPANYASARAFLKAGWTVVRTSTRDCLASIRCNDAQR